MDEDFLKRALRRPEVQREILGDYAGGFMLGVTRLPGEVDLVVLLRVEGEKSRSRRTMKVDDQEVELVVEGGFQPVRPLKGR